MVDVAVGQDDEVDVPGRQAEEGQRALGGLVGVEVDQVP
jgi:hypothetical protein